MCAIFGWLGSDSSERLRVMASTVRHRGPDGEGFMHTDHAAIGMTRLAIIDLENGQQPFHSDDQSISVVCNGEIYNFSELKRQLLDHGHTFQTDCDCEILPAAYQQWGIDFLNKVNGMFAMAIYDHDAGRLTLARDRFGQKPLYYATHRGNLYFSSEIRALHKVGVPKALNHSAIPSYLSLRYVPEPETMFQNIMILPVGSLLTVDESAATPEISKWYEIPTQRAHSVDPDPRAELHEITRTAIHSSLISDVPIALHLSAGIDSSVLLSEIQKTETPIQCVTAGFGASSDEVIEAAALCKKYAIPHTSVSLCADDIRSLPTVVSQMELPVGDALILAFDRLAEATASAGCKVAIGGEGIDEAFAGYSFHKFMMLGEKLGSAGRAIAVRALALTPEYILNKLSAFPANLGKSGRLKIQHYLHSYNHLTDYEKGVNLRTLFSQAEINQLALNDREIKLPQLAQGELLENHLKHQFDSWMQDWAIIRQERNTMAHSVEYRMPFLDHRIVEFAFSQENKEKLNGKSGKHIWRKMAANYYPETQHKRTKQPFFFPTEEPAYFKEITTLLDSTLGSEKFQQRNMFDLQNIKNLRQTAERTREFLPIKQLLSIAILELWMVEHDL